MGRKGCKKSLDCGDSDSRVECCYEKQKCCVPINKDKYLVGPGPKPVKICPPINCRKPCLIGCGDFTYQQYPKLKYHKWYQGYGADDDGEGEEGRNAAHDLSNGYGVYGNATNDYAIQSGQSRWKLQSLFNIAFQRSVCGKLRFDEQFTLQNPDGVLGPQNVWDIGTSGPRNACGQIWSCCGTGTWDTDGSCLNALAWKSAAEQRNPSHALIDTLIQTIVNRKFYYRFVFCPAVRKDQPLTATIEFVHLPADNYVQFKPSAYHSSGTGTPNPDGIDSPVDPGLVAVATLTRQYVQSCDGATVFTGSLTGWNIASYKYAANVSYVGRRSAPHNEATYEGGNYPGYGGVEPGFAGSFLPQNTLESRRLPSDDELPYVGHICLKLANPFDRNSWCDNW